MSTPFSDIFSAFFDKVEKDEDFFNYYNLSDVESMAIATERSKTYLKESVSKLTLLCSPDINFNNYDNVIQEFSETLTNTEVDILASLMFEKYVSRDIAKLKTFEVNFTPTDLQVFDPSSGRRTFMDMYRQLQSENESMIDDYISKDRITGKKKGINFSQYEEY